MNLKTLNLTVLLVTILVLLPTIQIVYASPLSTFFLSGGIYPHGVSFTAWKESNTYYAKTSYGVQTTFSGTTNGSLFIQNILDAVSASEGNVFFKKAEYEFDVGVHVDLRGGKGNIKLDAEKGTVFKATTNLVNLVWLCMFEFYGGDGITICNIIFDLANTETSYVFMFGGYNATNNVEICYCSFINGIDPITHYQSMAIVSSRGSHYNIHNNYFEDFEQGIVIGCGGTHQDSINIHENDFQSVGHAINLERGTPTYTWHGVIVANNIINGSGYARNSTNVQDGINIFGYGDVDGCVVSGNHIIFDVGTNATGIRLTQINYAEVVNNIVSGANRTPNESDLWQNGGGIWIRACNFSNIAGNNILNSYYGIGLVNYGATVGSYYNRLNNNGCWGAEGINILDSTTGTNNEFHLSWNGTTWIS